MARSSPTPLRAGLRSLVLPGWGQLGAERRGLGWSDTQRGVRLRKREPGGFDPGATAVMDVAAHVTDLDIDHFLLVDMTGFEAVVDSFGGVTMTVPEPVHGPLYDPVTGEYGMIRIDGGEQTLDGGEALAYSRSRLDDSDYDRMARQRCLLTALVDNVDPVSLLAGWGDLRETIETHLTTDLPLDMVPDLIRLAGNVSAPEVAVVGFGPDCSSGRTSSGYAIPDVERIRETVLLTLAEATSVAAARPPPTCAVDDTHSGYAAGPGHPELEAARFAAVPLWVVAARIMLPNRHPDDAKDPEHQPNTWVALGMIIALVLLLLVVLSVVGAGAATIEMMQ